MNLTKPQKLIYDMERFAGGSINVICGCMLLPGAKPEAELVAGVNRVFQLNDALRIRISEEDGQPSQQVIPYTEKNIEVLHFASKAEMDSYAKKSAEESFGFYGDLCNIQVVILPEQYGLLVKFHHIVGDAWTIALIGTQFNNIMNGEEPSACSYCEYVESEKEYLESQRYENDRTFFLEQFKKCDEVTYLSEKQAASYNATRKTFVLDAGKTQLIKDYATQSKSSAYALFMTALAIYMNRTNMNVEKFYLGTAVLNRSGVREKRTMGMFVNTVPMLIELENIGSFAENLAAMGKTIFSAFRHQKFNYGDVLSAIRKEYSFSEKLYDVMLSYQNATITGGDCETTWYHSGMQNESLQIHIDDRDREGVFRIHYDYQTDKFTVQEIEALHNHLMTLLQDAIENDTKKLYELELLPSEEKQKVLFDFNNTDMDYPRDKCVHQLFEEQVKHTPDKVAVVACDKTLTYSELNEQANRIAHSLIRKGVTVGDIVAFSLPRRSYLIATMLGILKAGAAYLPIDPDSPQDRIDYMLEDSKAKSFITEESLPELNNTNPEKDIRSDQCCYHIYTSGTTGNPKAASITHQNVVNFCDQNIKNHFQNQLLNDCECVLAINNISFDIALQETFLPLLNGSPIALSADTASVTSICQIMNGRRLGLIITPTKLEVFLRDETFCEKLKDFAVIMIGAEVLHESLVNRLRELTNAVIVNGYGPTETTCGCCYASIEHLFENRGVECRCVNPSVFISSQNLCYCIYTSGSTGKPKGVMLKHSNVVNYVNNNNNNVVHAIIKENYKTIVSVTTCGFDIFVTESLLPLANGLEILLANEEQAKFQSELNALLNAYPVDVLQTTPTKMKSLIVDAQQTDYLKNINAIVLGGEAVDEALVSELHLYTDAKIFNIYGPTETTVWSTNAEIKKEK